MLTTQSILIMSFGYIGLLFAIAYYGDTRAAGGKSIISNAYIYALSMGVYCTTWTFYGSVGRAATSGIAFLPIYIGPTLMATLGWVVLRKMVRISKVHRITSIADFIASRYGKSTALGSVITIIAVLGVVPYISLQLKAISTSFLILKQYPRIAVPDPMFGIPAYHDTAFYVALILALFAILFGTRHLETTERHEGLVAAVAFESIVKLAAFISVGIFVTYGVYNGFSDLAEKTHAVESLRTLFTLETSGYAAMDWAMYILLSMLSVLLLPRQFQIAVVENVNESHIRQGMWMFPLYLFAINLFVLPVAFGGVLTFAGRSVDADTFVLTLPMAQSQQWLALFAFIGGISAATGMVIVETVALSTMICNDLVMPVLLRLPFFGLSSRIDLRIILLTVRRSSIVLVLLLGYAHYYLVGEFYTLVSIGLMSFAAVAQFAPAILCGMYWKGAGRTGALCGVLCGFGIWLYTLVLPSLVQAGWISESFINQGPFGLAWLRPYQLFGLKGYDPLTHSVFWSLLVNIGVTVGVSLFSRPRAIEHTQAVLFVDVFKHSQEVEDSPFRRGTAPIPDLRTMLRRFLGKRRAEQAMSEYAQRKQIDWGKIRTADAGLVGHVEKLLAGVIGSASARVMVSSVVKEEPLGIEEVMDLVDETRQIIAYSHELETTTRELEAANERLQELDRLKDEFISTVTHELRTPLTAIRSIAEILLDNPGMDAGQQKEFTEIIVKESERLTRLINQVLDFQKIESGRMQWQLTAVDMKEIIRDSVQATDRLIRDRDITLEVHLPPVIPLITGDRDRLIQVMVNLISNAVKFSDANRGQIQIILTIEPAHLKIDVGDNGIGIRPDHQEHIFEAFRQITDNTKGRPPGSGLGLVITRRIIQYHQGNIWVESEPEKGSTFSFRLPLKPLLVLQP